ncbi:MAG: glycosyltransferase family 39 protein [Chloroflexi bacterium]|nr:glycosyltransferase family 39 protein [Chloroflexota bacterium]
MGSKKQSNKLLLILLSISLIYQSLNILTDARQDLVSIRKNIGQSGTWRSANYFHSQRLADYVTFLNDIIPEDARVVLPPLEISPTVLARPNYMQYFLDLGDVVNCTKVQSTCMSDLSEAGGYVLITSSEIFPGIEFDGDTDKIRMFDDEWGVLLPEEETDGSITPLNLFESFENILGQVIWIGLWILLLIGGGLLVTLRMLPGWGLLAKLSIGLGLAFGFHSLSLYILMLFGMLPSQKLIIGITVFWLLLGAGIYWYSNGDAHLKIDGFGIQKELGHFDIWHVGLLILGLLAAVIAVGKSYHTVDALALWADRGYGLAAEGLPNGASNWGNMATKYPLHIPILIASFKTMFGNMLPASKFIFPVFYLGLMLVTYDFLRRHVPRTIAGLTTLTLGTTPLIFRHATIGYANQAMAFYLVIAVLITAEIFNTADNVLKKERKMLLSGIFFSLCAWTRPEALEICAILIIFILANGRFKWGKRWPRLALLVSVPFVVYSGIWFSTMNLAYTRTTGTSELAAEVFAQISQGNFHFPEIGFILEYALLSLFNFEVWGVIGLGVLLISLMAFVQKMEYKPSLIVVFSGLICIFLGMGVMFLASYNTGSACDLSCWLATGYNRYIIPGMFLLWIGQVSKVFQ